MKYFSGNDGLWWWWFAICSCGQNRQKVRPLIGSDDHQLQPAETTLGTYVDAVIYTTNHLVTRITLQNLDRWIRILSSTSSYVYRKWSILLYPSQWIYLVQVNYPIQSYIEKLLEFMCLNYVKPQLRTILIQCDNTVHLHSPAKDTLRRLLRQKCTVTGWTQITILVAFLGWVGLDWDKV